MNSASIVLLAGRGAATNILYNYLQSRFAVGRALLESRSSRVELLRRRLRRYGLAATTGQLGFRALVFPMLQMSAARRLREIKRGCALDATAIPAELVTSVDSVNGKATIKILQDLRPSVVVVNGTRLIGPEVLRSVPASFVNIHAGTTPLYRGVHGAYWALARGEPENCGVTVHLIDEGIDTGRPLAYARVEVTRHDNVATYPLLQLAAALPLLESVLHDLLEGRTPLAAPAEGSSRLWSHPTFFEYMSNRVLRGVK